MEVKDVLAILDRTPLEEKAKFINLKQNFFEPEGYHRLMDMYEKYDTSGFGKRVPNPTGGKTWLDWHPNVQVPESFRQGILNAAKRNKELLASYIDNVQQSGLNIADDYGKLTSKIINQKGYIQPGQVVGSVFRTAGKVLQESAGPLAALDAIGILSNAPSSNQSQGMNKAQEQDVKDREINQMYLQKAKLMYPAANDFQLQGIANELKARYENINQKRSQPQLKAW